MLGQVWCHWLTSSSHIVYLSNQFFRDIFAFLFFIFPIFFLLAFFVVLCYGMWVCVCNLFQSVSMYFSEALFSGGINRSPGKRVSIESVCVYSASALIIILPKPLNNRGIEQKKLWNKKRTLTEQKKALLIIRHKREQRTAFVVTTVVSSISLVQSLFRFDFLNTKFKNVLKFLIYVTILYLLTLFHLHKCRNKIKF